jgi:hypothetical protein
MNGIDEVTHVPKVKDIIERPIRGDQVKAVITRRCCRSRIGLGFLPHSVLTLVGRETFRGDLLATRSEKYDE